MISEEEFLETELKVGISPFNPGFVELGRQTAIQVIAACEFETVLDYGAGVGVYANEMRKLGKSVKAWEKFKPHKKFMREEYPELEIIEEPITTDLMMWIEVAEHMTDQEHIDLFKIIQPKYILFSSTSERTENDEAWGHINVKRQEEWIEMFTRFGYEFVKDMTLPTVWTKLFKRI